MNTSTKVVTSELANELRELVRVAEGQRRTRTTLHVPSVPPAPQRAFARMELEEQLRCVELLVLTWSEPMDFYFLDEVQLAKDRQHPLMFTKMEGRHLRAWYGPLPSEWAHREVIPETSLLFSVEERGDSYSAYDDGEPFNYIDQFVSRILKDADPDRVVRGCEVWNPCYF